MADVFDAKTRSRVMSRIRGKDTKPELILRRGLHAYGFRYSLHSRKLPGKPDLVLTRYGAVCFVNGCFWHRHQNCRYVTTPEHRFDFWQQKFKETVARDKRNHSILLQQGWRVAVIWECQLKTNWQEETILRTAEWIKNKCALRPSDIWTPMIDAN